MYTVTLFNGYERVASVDFKSDYDHRANAIAAEFARGVPCTGFTVTYTAHPARKSNPVLVSGQKV